MFEHYPKIDYKFINENGKITNLEVVDIFRNVSIKKETLNDSSNFRYHVVGDGDTPEQIAVNLYNDSFLWWVVLLTNGIIDKNQEWPKDTREINRIFDEFLDGSVYFIVENPAIQKDDIMVKRDVDKTGSVDIEIFGIINEYDKHLHKIKIKTDRSEGTFEENDEFYLFRRDAAAKWNPVSGMGLTACAKQTLGSTAGCTPVGYLDFPCGTGPYCATAGSTYGIIRKKSTFKSAVKQFEVDGVPIDPYAVPNSIGGATGSYYSGAGQNICGLTSTVLYKYIDGSLQSNHPTIKVIGDGADIIRKNDDRRIIKILTPIIVRKIVGEIKAVMNSTVPPGTTKYIEFDF
jgi:hypothetical protein